MRTPLLTDGMRHRIDSRATAFHSRTLELLRDMPGNRCGVEVRQFSDTVVATAATSTPETQCPNGVEVRSVEPGPDDAAVFARVHLGAAGCELATSLATPDTTSHRNLERAGFGVAYTKVVWTVVER